LISFFNCLYSPLYAQQSLEDCKKKLCGNKNRQWIFKNTKIILSGEKCEDGYFYTFKSTGDLKVKKCENEKWITEDKKWKIIKNADSEYLLKIGNEDPYNIIFFTKKGKNWLRLRKYSTQKGDPTTDIDFYYEAE
jgi:hypothetical protein